jgi:hypothetical protein
MSWIDIETFPEQKVCGRRADLEQFCMTDDGLEPVHTKEPLQLYGDEGVCSRSMATSAIRVIRPPKSAAIRSLPYCSSGTGSSVKSRNGLGGRYSTGMSPTFL